MRQFILYFLHVHLLRRRVIRKYLSDSDSGPRRLQIGGGRHTIEGWLNGDIIGGDIYLDATQPLPFPNHSLDFIFAEQFIEHISLDNSRKLLKECHRAMRAGGVIRLATPDLESLIQTYRDENPNVTLKQAMERHRKGHNQALSTSCHFFNNCLRLWGHKFIYDEMTLKDVLEEAGFTNITRHQFGESRYRELVGKERHADVEWMKYGWTLILEGEKSNGR